jgi:hypothetical protein
MEEDTTASNLFYLLLQYDNSWHVVSIWHNRTIIANSEGREVHAPTLVSALRGALALYTGEY